MLLFDLVTCGAVLTLLRFSWLLICLVVCLNACVLVVVFKDNCVLVFVF